MIVEDTLAKVFAWALHRWQVTAILAFSFAIGFRKVLRYIRR